MPKLKLTKTVVDAAQPEKDPYELRDTIDTGFLAQGHADRPQGLHGGLCRQQRPAPQAGDRPLRRDHRRAGPGHRPRLAGRRPQGQGSECAEERRTPSAHSQGTLRTVHRRLLRAAQQALDGRLPTVATASSTSSPISARSRSPDVTRADISSLMKKMSRAPDERQPGALGRPQDVQHGRGLGPAP